MNATPDGGYIHPAQVPTGNDPTEYYQSGGAARGSGWWRTPTLPRIRRLGAVAVCSYEDVFDLQTGKVLALERLLEQARIFAPDDIYVYIGDVLTANRVKLERQQARQRARQQVRQ